MTIEGKTPEVRRTVDGHVCVISLDNVSKKNAITPELMSQLSAHLTTFEEDDDLWVAVLDPAGEHTTAGLDMPKFFGPAATAKPIPKNQVDPFALYRRTTKPVISVVHGITYTIGIEMMLAGDIVIAADTARFRQLESKRGIAPLGGAHFRYLTRTGWGNAMYHLFLCDEFDAQEALRIGFVQEVHPYGKHRERAIEIARGICTCAPLGLRATKKAALAYLEQAERAAVEVIPAASLDEIYRLVVDGAEFSLASARGENRDTTGARVPDLVLTAPARVLVAARRGETTLADALATGAASASGSKRALRNFQRVFRLP